MTRSSFSRRQRAQQCRLEQRINALIASDGDHCGVCRKPLAQAGLTFYGVRFGQLIIAGECCGKKLEWLLAQGIYIHSEAS